VTHPDVIPLDAISCDLTVFERGEGRRHAELVALLRAATQAREELPQGWRFVLAPEAFAAAAEWITYERRCCAFFDFTLDWPAAAGPVLTITGPAEAKRFLADW
jgi:hypothetical protein